ncbi:MAG TPA: cupin domain-containing protein [Bacteroidia bacterium]|nr:cupin domain-containing protein [Bacteroidia bacterium]HNP98694.1 cupin domain-containing protein [Bacteroidia bacterium]
MKVNIEREIPWFGGNSFHPVYFDESVFRIEAKLAAGKSAPPHYHKHFDEHWTIKQGRPTFVVGKERTTLKEGDTFFCPRLVEHELRNDTTEDVILITEMRPAADMAKMMSVIAGLQDDKEKAWMFKYFYVEKRAGLKEFSNPTGMGIRIMTSILMPITMLIGRLSGWDKFLDKYF